MKQKKLLWIVAGIALLIILCGLLTWYGSGMLEMIRAHLGM